MRHTKRGDILDSSSRRKNGAAYCPNDGPYEIGLTFSTEAYDFVGLAKNGSDLLAGNQHKPLGRLVVRKTASERAMFIM